MTYNLMISSIAPNSTNMKMYIVLWAVKLSSTNAARLNLGNSSHNTCSPSSAGAVRQPNPNMRKMVFLLFSDFLKNM